MLTPIDKVLSGRDSEFSGVGSISVDADKHIKLTPLKYLEETDENAIKTTAEIKQKEEVNA